jgi:hypothetical protein
MVLKRHNGNSWYSTDRIWAARRCHMHAGKRPCGPFRCDDAAELQVEGPDALETRQDLIADEYRKDSARPHT